MPERLLIHARLHRGVVHAELSAQARTTRDERYMLFVRGSDRLELIEHPGLILRNGVWHSDGLELASQMIRVIRGSKRHDEKEYSCDIRRTRDFIRVPGMGDIYVYGMTHANKVLPSEYYHVCHGADSERRWHFCKRDIAIPAIPVALPVAPPVAPPIGRVETPPVASAPATAKIPQHIFRMFVDAAIEKKEECPITMEPLTRETVAGTACGHLFDRLAITRVLAGSRRCPTCRAECGHELQTY
jgi:hypothetical protein